MTQATASLVILGKDADIDNFIRKTRSNILDVKGEVLGESIKAVSEKFMDTFWYGGVTSVNAKEFDGLQTLIANTTYNTIHAGTTSGSALSVVKLQQAIDLITFNTPTDLFMTKAMRRGINVYLDSIGDKFTAVRNEYGKMIEYFRGLKITTDDHLLDTETASTGAYSASTGSDNSTIFILSFGPKAVCGIQGPDQVETIPLGDLETKDAQRWRIRWYCGLKFEDLRSCAKLDGITTASTVTA